MAARGEMATVSTEPLGGLGARCLVAFDYVRGDQSGQRRRRALFEPVANIAGYLIVDDPAEPVGRTTRVEDNGDV